MGRRYVYSMVLLVYLLLSPRMIYTQTAVPPAAGDGTRGNPYQIATIDNLYWIASDSNHWTDHYIQTADINASVTAGWFGGQGWLPIGSKTTEFSGTYDGNGYRIDSVFVNRTMFAVGLFSTLGDTVRNLGVTHVNISGNEHVGGIAGFLNPGSIVRNCYASGHITGGSKDSHVGVGGIAGISASGIIENSYSTVDVTSSTGYGGGLLGFTSTGIVVNCYSLGSVNGNGGLIGYTWQSVVMNCYAAGPVSGSNLVGGFTGSNMLGFIVNSFWDMDSSGQPSSAGGIGKSTADLKDPFLFVTACWDSSIWSMDTGYNNGYPYLWWQHPDGSPLPGGHVVHPAAGDGTKDNPFQIATLENLYWVASNPILWNQKKYYIQVADINASATRNLSGGEGWEPIGYMGDAQEFNGVYNGTGHSIDSLYINRPGHSYQGLFGYLSSSEIDSVGLSNCDFTGKDYMGGIAGITAICTVRNCYTTGKVTGNGAYVGGLVGYENFCNVTKITECYSRTAVTGVNAVGGLVGGAYVSGIERCYSSGAVKGNQNTGGFLGFNLSTFVVSSFWDSVSSKQTLSGEGVGKTTTEMKSPSTYAESGWNNTTWYMDSSYNDGYPYFSWQHPSGTPLPRMPGLRFSVAAVNFGTVHLNASKQDSVRITNTGTDTLKISSIVSTNSNFTYAMPLMEFAPSGSAYLKLTCTLQDTTKQSGFIILTSNESHSPDTLTVTGQGTILTSIVEKTDHPISFSIGQNFPNPFNPTTRIEYTIPHASLVSLKVYDILGRNVSQLVNEVQQSGRYEVLFDGSGLSSGIYFYSIDANNFHQIRKMVLMK